NSICHSFFLLTAFCSWYGLHRDLHSFPTRRSSDLASHHPTRPESGSERRLPRPSSPNAATSSRSCSPAPLPLWVPGASSSSPSRSEEHTSELQSPYDLVCRLLLEKKK